VLEVGVEIDDPISSPLWTATFDISINPKIPSDEPKSPIKTKQLLYHPMNLGERSLISGHTPPGSVFEVLVSLLQLSYPDMDILTDLVDWDQFVNSISEMPIPISKVCQVFVFGYPNRQEFDNQSKMCILLKIFSELNYLHNPNSRDCQLRDKFLVLQSHGFVQFSGCLEVGQSGPQREISEKEKAVSLAVLGLMLYNLICGQTLFDELETKTRCQVIEKADLVFAKGVTKKLQDIIVKCVTSNLQNMPKVEELLTSLFRDDPVFEDVSIEISSG
jgi:hypothetical protein